MFIFVYSLFWIHHVDPNGQRISQHGLYKIPDWNSKNFGSCKCSNVFSVLISPRELVFRRMPPPEAWRKDFYLLFLPDAWTNEIQNTVNPQDQHLLCWIIEEITFILFCILNESVCDARILNPTARKVAFHNRLRIYIFLISPLKWQWNFWKQIWGRMLLNYRCTTVQFWKCLKCL